MKSIPVLFAVILWCVSAAAEPFSPTLLKIKADPVVLYDFEGSVLEIPVTIEGVSCELVFCVFTHGRENYIEPTTNGFLGWHYVNKTDTCMYFSSPVNCGVGQNIVSWDGRDQDGGYVPAGKYLYYLWGYNKNEEKPLMYKFVGITDHFSHDTDILEIDEEGLPLSKPIWYRPRERWIIGNDPEDESLRETGVLNLSPGWGVRGKPQIDTQDSDYFFLPVFIGDGKGVSIQKLKWIPNGEAEIVKNWGSDAPYATKIDAEGGRSPGLETDGDYLYYSFGNWDKVTEPYSFFTIYDMNGSLVENIDLVPWWGTGDDDGPSGGRNMSDERHGCIVFNSNMSCLNQMVNPKRYLDSDEYNDLLVWSNGNGDNILDKNFEETARTPWVCNDYNAGHWVSSMNIDENIFSIAMAYYDFMDVYFGLFAPDGTGLGHFTLDSNPRGPVYGVILLDGGTPYDGIYSNDPEGYAINTDPVWIGESGVYYTAHDSIQGIITSGHDVTVDQDKPEAFTLAQNTPNPFNPTTSISFTLPMECAVELTVYNVGGAKVATLADGLLSSGEHNVTWDASGFPSGVYFYRLKGLDFEGTGKMTLVK